MSRFLLALAAFAFAAPLFAQPKDPPPTPEAKLKVGDPAPPLVVDKWLVGKEVKGFEKDTVYVINFAATATPFGVAALSDLYDKSGGKGLVVVGVLSPNYGGVKWDDKGLEKELTFLTTSAKESGASYPVGWEKERKLYDAYIGIGQVPVAFVVDKAGKLAYAGPDATTAYVAGKVLDGTWKGKADVDAMTEATTKLGKFMDELGKKVGPPDKLDEKGVKTLQAELPALEKMFKDAPFLLADERGWSMRFAVHLFAQSYDVAEEMVTARLAIAERRKNKGMLGEMGFMLASAPIKSDPKLSKLVAKFTDAYAKLLDPKKAATDEFTDWVGLVLVSKKHGNADQAAAYTKTILDATPADKRKEAEEAIKRTLKDAGLGDK